MEEVTLKDILDILVDIKVEINGIKDEQTGMKQEQQGMKQEMQEMKQEQQGMKQDMQEMKQKMKEMDEKIDRNFEETKNMILQLQKDVTEENVWIVKKLAEHDRRLNVIEEKLEIKKKNGKIVEFKGKDK